MVKVENLARARDAQPPTSSRTLLIKSVIKRNYLEWEGRERMCIGRKYRSGYESRRGRVERVDSAVEFG